MFNQFVGKVLCNLCLQEISGTDGIGGMDGISRMDAISGMDRDGVAEQSTSMDAAKSDTQSAVVSADKQNPLSWFVLFSADKNDYFLYYIVKS